MIWVPRLPTLSSFLDRDPLYRNIGVRWGRGWKYSRRGGFECYCSIRGGPSGNDHTFARDIAHELLTGGHHFLVIQIGKINI